MDEEGREEGKEGDPPRPVLEERALLLLRARGARVGDEGMEAARRGEEVFFGGGVGGHVVHVGFGG